MVMGIQIGLMFARGVADLRFRDLILS